MILLSVAAYIFVFCCVMCLPFLVFSTARFIAEKTKRFSLTLAAVVLAAELLCAGVLFFHPVYICPKNYEVYISSERESRLKAGESAADRGFVSAEIPFLAVVNEVTFAGENAVHIRTWYFPFGHSETGVSDDGLFSINW